MGSNIALNHAVQLVGYGTDAAEGDYWIVRNSWGSGWGEGGYIRLARDAEAQCGTDSTPMDGTACVGGPGNDEQHVCGQCGVLFDVSWPLGATRVVKPKFPLLRCLTFTSTIILLVLLLALKTPLVNTTFAACLTKTPADPLCSLLLGAHVSTAAFVLRWHNNFLFNW